MNQIYHVSKEGHDSYSGAASSPFLSIGKAAKVANLGDTIIVHEGIYREWVKPIYGGHSELTRITYRAAEGEQVVIKGSEVITDWQSYKGTVWKAEIDNTVFGDYNPYTESLYGDWFLMPLDGSAHTGDVYLNGQSLYEAKSIEAVEKAEIVERIDIDGHGYMETRLYPENMKYQWYAEVNEATTIIYANFQDKNPNEELIEINVRKCCFYPEKTGVSYITVDGFEMAHAATPFTPPTADQPGLIGPNWSYGWIIENNVIHDSKCSGISLGKEMSTGHNEHALFQMKPGFQGQIESVFKALKRGWSRELVGSHIVRNNRIYDCGQNGIVGHMGCIFSEIYGNHIYNIGIKYEFFGWEIAGIKFHAPIDVMIRNNYVHHCYLGLWLDWQTQGTRVSSNIFRENPRDCVVEVSHGPYLFDNNIFGSETNVSMLAQGGAFIHNLFCGKINIGKVLDRSTPYHEPHSTDVTGCSLVYGKDDRWYNNIFCDTHEKNQVADAMNLYNGAPTSLEEYRDIVISLGNEDIEKYVRVEQPAYINCNFYSDEKKCFDKEEQFYIGKIHVEFVEENETLRLMMKVNTAKLGMETQLHGTNTLGTVRIVDATYEDKNGDSILIDCDFYGEKRTSKPLVGPFEKTSVTQEYCLW